MKASIARYAIKSPECQASLTGFTDGNRTGFSAQR